MNPDEPACAVLLDKHAVLSLPQDKDSWPPGLCAVNSGVCFRCAVDARQIGLKAQYSRDLHISSQYIYTYNECSSV